ncbi:MAG TPA: ABC transporter substrate-binding protein, partial [Mycobacteriales bacterium]|nr:ABC transporter substrate-binding protein [Mycobacteriales bacterium]
GPAASRPAARSDGAPTSHKAASSAPAIANPLYTGALDTRGITPTSINLCAHAALTFGPAFDTRASDLNVYWQALNDKGGVLGRKITETYQDDQYKPGPAVDAATKCAASNPFLILGGIGFDQIPAVREWAEQHKELYLYHDATANGEAGKRYSFSALPTVEQLGVQFAEVAHEKLPTAKWAVIHRDSAEWSPGYEQFMATAKQLGVDVVYQAPVTNQQSNYTQAIVNAEQHGATAVFSWENALATTEMVKQAKAVSYSPTWLVFPFNLTSQTIGDGAMTPPMIGVATWPAYAFGASDGLFAAYAADMREFEAEYAKYDPGAALGGVAGDLLFLNWEGQKALAQMLTDCGKDCTRSRLANMLATGYHHDFGGGCAIDFRPGDHHIGGHTVNVFTTFRNGDGKIDWRPTQLCRPA